MSSLLTLSGFSAICIVVAVILWFGGSSVRRHTQIRCFSFKQELILAFAERLGQHYTLPIRKSITPTQYTSNIFKEWTYINNKHIQFPIAYPMDTSNFRAFRVYGLRLKTSRYQRGEPGTKEVLYDKILVGILNMFDILGCKKVSIQKQVVQNLPDVHYHQYLRSFSWFHRSAVGPKNLQKAKSKAFLTPNAPRKTYSFMLGVFSVHASKFRSHWQSSKRPIQYINIH